jgi:MFS family permease
LFADTGLSQGRISVLFTIWSAVSIVAEMPTGAFADRFSRRSALVAAGVLQAAGFALWAAVPGFPGYAGGFALWGLGGSFVSGALQALIFDGLAAVGAEAHYARVLGRVSAAGLLGQLPAAAAATVLFALGGYPLVTWASVGCCLAAAGFAAWLPEAAPARANTADARDRRGFVACLRDGIAVARTRASVRGAIIAVAILTGIDALEEYFPLLARDWGVPTRWTPAAIVAIPLVGAAGAALAGRAAGLGPRTLAVILGVAGLMLGTAGLLRQPVGLVAIASFYGVYRLVLVIADTRLQERIEAASRATVTSVAGLVAELSVFALYAAWALGGVLLVAAFVLVIAATLPRLLRAG